MGKISTAKNFEKIIRELNEILKKKYIDFKGTTFFGSRNRGDFSSESDFDVVVLFTREPDWEKENEVLDIIYEMELKYDILIDRKKFVNRIKTFMATG
ncbi:MAG: nucleotidyltransferase domain-containing protein [Candidatus Aminicenantes bacterium]|nr:nucleotidyltransferase domain-containing protein [Candidatus Aminicenantes bacterium]